MSKQMLPRIATAPGKKDVAKEYIYISQLAKKARDRVEELDLPAIIQAHVMNMDIKEAMKFNTYLINNQLHIALREVLKKTL